MWPYSGFIGLFRPSYSRSLFFSAGKVGRPHGEHPSDNNERPFTLDRNCALPGNRPRPHSGSQLGSSRSSSEQSHHSWVPLASLSRSHAGWHPSTTFRWPMPCPEFPARWPPVAHLPPPRRPLRGNDQPPRPLTYSAPPSAKRIPSVKLSAICSGKRSARCQVFT